MWLLILPMYTGPYRRSREQENPVETLDYCLENIEVRKFVAVHLPNYDKVPVIGKVLELNEDMVKIHHSIGYFKGKWSPQDVPRRWTPWVDELPPKSIILSSFSLTEHSRVLLCTRNHLQDERERIELFVTIATILHIIHICQVFLKTILSTLFSCKHG